MTIEIGEAERQTLLLALAELALSRPGWDEHLGEIADAFLGREMFDEFRRLNADRVVAERGSLGPVRKACPQEASAEAQTNDLK
jgi:hypothetical protein